jgi:hypothetical protein
MEICLIGGGNHTNNELGEVFLELSKMIKKGDCNESKFNDFHYINKRTRK